MTPSLPQLVIAYGTVPAHDLLVAEVARFHDVRPDSVVVVHECPRCGSDEHGRPRVLPTASLPDPAHVSVSRAGALSMVAVTDAGLVGVDLEPAGAAGFAGFDDVALHPDERGEEADDPTRVWVRKEALLKAAGLGLAIDPSHVHVDGNGVVSWASPHEAPGPVLLRDLDVPDHVAAVALIPDAERDMAHLDVSLHRL